MFKTKMNKERTLNYSVFQDLETSRLDSLQLKTNTAMCHLDDVENSVELTDHCRLTYSKPSEVLTRTRQLAVSFFFIFCRPMSYRTGNL